MEYTSHEKATIRVLIVSTLTIVAAGAVFYHFVEGFSWLDAYYFTIITLPTVGYGDLSPHTGVGKLFTTFYILIGIGIITAFITTLARYRTRRRVTKKTHDD